MQIIYKFRIFLHLVFFEGKTFQLPFSSFFRFYPERLLNLND